MDESARLELRQTMALILEINSSRQQVEAFKQGKTAEEEQEINQAYSEYKSCYKKEKDSTACLQQIVSGTSPRTPEPSSLLANEAQQREPVLYVNTSDTHYSVERSLEDGIRDLHQLANTKGIKEDIWLWVRIQTPEMKLREFWYEVGSEETSDQAMLDFYRVLYPVIKDATQKGAILEWRRYHIHPVSDDAEQFDIEYPPSQTDINSYLNTEVVRMVDRWPVATAGEEHVVAPNGIWSLRWEKPSAAEGLPPLPPAGTFDSFSDEAAAQYARRQQYLTDLLNTNRALVHQTADCRDKVKFSEGGESQYRTDEIACIELIEGVDANFSPLYLR